MPWALCFVPTFAISVDLCVLSYKRLCLCRLRSSRSGSDSGNGSSRSGGGDGGNPTGVTSIVTTATTAAAFEFSHDSSVFLWLLANFSWAMGEQFWPQYDDVLPLGRPSRLATETGRWWAQVWLVCAMLPPMVAFACTYSEMMNICKQEPEAEGKGEKEEKGGAAFMGEVCSPVQEAAL